LKVWDGGKKMEPRKLRGAAIAKAGGLRQRGDHLWFVPSQSHSGSWVVDYTEGEPTCTCPDYEKRSAFCKHIFAVEISEARISMPSDTPPKKTYTQDWPAYNAAQKNEGKHFRELLFGLCQGITMKPQTGRGRPKTPLADVVFASVMKVYTGFSGRRVTSELERCVTDGLMDKAPSYNSISDYLKSKKLTPLLRELMQESASPLAGVESQFAVDSTGFSTRTYDRWYDEKWGKSRR
jgi:hypothetical protein